MGVLLSIAGPTDSFRTALMQAFTVDRLRQQFDDILGLAETEDIILTRNTGENLMLVSEARWRSLQETVHLLGTSLNEERLQQSLQQLRADYLTRHETT